MGCYNIYSRVVLAVVVLGSMGCMVGDKVNNTHSNQTY